MRREAPIEFEDEPSREEMDALDERINAFNADVTGYRDGRWLTAFVRDADGSLRAGLVGHTWGGCAEVRTLWVREDARRAGLGSRLLRAAEREAAARGCERIVLSTHSFQAPGFYRRHGYERLGEAPGYPRGHAQLYLGKRLGPPAG